MRPDGVQRATVPSLEIAGGTERRDVDGRRSFRFVRAGFSYTLAVAAGDASLTVRRGERVIVCKRS